MRMKKNLKKQLSACLCLLLAVMVALCGLFQPALEAHADSGIQLSWDGNYGGYELEIHMTKSTYGFHAGDYIKVLSASESYKDQGYLSNFSGVTYSSSNPSVASVDQTGLVKPKKAGSANISVKYKGIPAQCTVKVVSSLGKDPSGMKYTLKKQFQALDKAYGKGMTASNKYNIVNARNLYENEGKYYSTYQAIVKTTSSEYDPEEGYIYKSVWKAYNPAVCRAYIISQAVASAIDSQNPIGDGDATMFKVAKVSGKGSTVTVKLSKKVTAGQIFAIQASVSKMFDSKVSKSKKTEFPVYIRDTKKGVRYYALATATQGKNTLTVKLQSSKLKKGTSYKLAGVSEWEAGLGTKWTEKGKITFKAK